MKKVFVFLVASAFLLTTNSIFAENPDNNVSTQNPPKATGDITIMGIPYVWGPGEIWCWPSDVIKCVTVHVPTPSDKGSKAVTTYDKDGNKASTFKVKDYQIQKGNDKTIIKLLR